MNFKEQPCPSCKTTIRFTPRPDGTRAWLACCEINVTYKDSQLVSIGSHVYDWVKKRGGLMRV